MSQSQSQSQFGLGSHVRRVDLCGRHSAKTSALGIPRYPSYPTLSPLSEATTYKYRSRQVVKDRHRPNNNNASPFQTAPTINIYNRLTLPESSTNHNIRVLAGIGPRLLTKTRMATPKLTLYVDTVSPFGESISLVLQPLKLRFMTAGPSFENLILTLCIRIWH
jgi:hypothetical protein